MSRESALPVAGLKPVDAEGLAFVRSVYDLWNGRGVEGVLRDVLHPDIEYHDPPGLPDATTVRGATAFAEHLKARLDAIPGSRVDFQSAAWVREGEVLLAELVLYIGGRVSGVELHTPLFHLMQLDAEGKAVELHEFTQLDQALEAVGLRR